jgi:hypothetical protein
MTQIEPETTVALHHVPGSVRIRFLMRNSSALGRCPSNREEHFHAEQPEVASLTGFPSCTRKQPRLSGGGFVFWSHLSLLIVGSAVQRHSAQWGPHFA